jgi:hypothetical protein
VNRLPDALILPEPTQPAKKQQAVTKCCKLFFSLLFAFFSQFTRICRDLYYAFTTFDGAPVLAMNSAMVTKQSVRLVTEMHLLRPSLTPFRVAPYQLPAMKYD